MTRLPKNMVQGRWAYQLGVLHAALDRLAELDEQWRHARDNLPTTAQPGTPMFDEALAEHHAEMWSYLDDWATHGKAIREINAATQKAPSPPAPNPAPTLAPGKQPATRK